MDSVLHGNENDVVVVPGPVWGKPAVADTRDRSHDRVVAYEEVLKVVKCRCIGGCPSSVSCRESHQ